VRNHLASTRGYIVGLLDNLSEFNNDYKRSARKREREREREREDKKRERDRQIDSL